MAGSIYFVPWLRGGIALGIARPETEALEPLTRAAVLKGRVKIDDLAAEASLSIRPSDHVVAIDPAQISRRYPAPNVPDAEYGYFPHIEFTAPDFPWVASPSAPDDSGKLRPWIVLICTEAARASLLPGTTDAAQKITVETTDLPDLTESWAWAHVQSMVPFSDVETAVHVPDGRVISRLVCPRRLAANTRYRAALVSAWVHQDGMLEPAWKTDDGIDTHTLMYSTPGLSPLAKLVRSKSFAND